MATGLRIFFTPLLFRGRKQKKAAGEHGSPIYLMRATISSISNIWISSQ